MTLQEMKDQIRDFIYRSGLTDSGSLAEAQELRKFLNHEIEETEAHLHRLDEEE